MFTKLYNVHPLLQDFVQCIMVVHAEVGTDEGPAVYVYPPTPQTSLFFYIDDRIRVKMDSKTEFEIQPRSVFVGQQLTRVALDIGRSHKAVRVGFHPGGLHRLLGISMAAMIDDHFDAGDVFGAGMREVNEKLAAANDFDEMHLVIENFLLQRVRKLKQALPFDKAMLELMHFGGNIPIEKIASLACLSLRQFERISKERVGLPPKLFARLVRFSKAYRLRENFPNWNWTNIAYECGYFDQMHLIRDFKQFAGVAPGIIEKELQASPVRLQAGLRL